MATPGEIYAHRSVNADILLTRGIPDSIEDGDYLSLVRDPNNLHHPHAIQLVDVTHNVVGYLDPEKSAVIAPLLDSDLLISSRAFVPKARTSKFGAARLSCELQLSLLPDNVGAVDTVISGGGSVTSKLKRISDDKLNQMFAQVGKNMPNQIEPMDAPKDIIVSSLMDHQKEALGWLIQCEGCEHLPPFWKLAADGSFMNILTNERTYQRPSPITGGIFADEMGLGKTLVMISLIARYRTANVAKEEGVGAKRRRVDSPTAGTTLVVCPVSAIKVWQMQIEEHTKKNSLKVYVYIADRTDDKDKLLQNDVVITSYSTLGAEYDKDGSPLKEISWFRVVLDEAHEIKSFMTRQSKAVISLNAQKRWILTGTPMENNLFNVYPLVAFLRYTPFANESHWLNLFESYVQKNKRAAMSRLKNLLTAISLRRTKETVNLPPRTVSVYRVEFSDEERYFYEKIEKEIKHEIATFGGGQEAILRNYSKAMQYIQTLRQMCVDIKLLPSDLIHSSPFEEAAEPTMLMKLTESVQEGEDYFCPVCWSTIYEAVITRCRHIFCRNCIETVVCAPDSKCPICRGVLAMADLFKAPRVGDVDEEGNTALSAKGKILLGLLKEKHEEDPSCKHVVFSQFRKMLVRLERAVKAEGLSVVRLDGEMSLKRRSELVASFSRPGPGGPSILLANMNDAGTGISLQCASTVFLFDPWFDAVAEEQAISRVHRIGQRKPVTVVKLVVVHSIEERVLEVQAAGGIGRKSEKDARLKGVAMLLGLD